MIDNEILERAMENLARERFQKELREAIVYGPKVLGELWNEYERLKNEMPSDEDYLAAMGPCGK